ncbi:hypothetical protein [Moraxella marmotae]|uniref:hypothetical protein n=1 Tax=Moraxella marmotae TaxID=3344520 RepID=UPI0035F3A9AE
MKLPSHHQANTAITIVSFLVLVFIAWRLYSVGFFGSYGYDMKNYDKKEDRPDMEKLEILMGELTNNLPQPQKINPTKKPNVIGINYTYLNLTSYQKSQMKRNLQKQPKWVFQERKQTRSGYSDYYCFNQFDLIIGVEQFDFTFIGKGSGEYTYLHVDWWQFGECRLKFLQNQYRRQNNHIN